MALASY